MTPARTGARDCGGTPDSRPEQHIAHVDRTRGCGSYHNYHHDVFQSGYGRTASPIQRSAPFTGPSSSTCAPRRGTRSRHHRLIENPQVVRQLCRCNRDSQTLDGGHCCK